MVNEVIGRVADKWTMLILEVLAEHGEQRFTRVGELVGGVSQKMLTQTLRQMERDGLIVRTVHPVIPPCVEYRLTDLGAIAGVLAGGGAAMAAVLITVLGPPLHGWAAELIGQPAAWTVPLAFLVMVTGSLVTSRRVPSDVGATMLRLHAPESLRI